MTTKTLTPEQRAKKNLAQKAYRERQKAKAAIDAVNNGTAVVEDQRITAPDSDPEVNEERAARKRETKTGPTAHALSQMAALADQLNAQAPVIKNGRAKPRAVADLPKRVLAIRIEHRFFDVMKQWCEDNDKSMTDLVIDSVKCTLGWS